MKITTIGIDLAKEVFQVSIFTLMEPPVFGLMEPL